MALSSRRIAAISSSAGGRPYIFKYAPRSPARSALATGAEWVDLDLVFAQPNGKAIERKSDWRAWKALLQEAGVRAVRLHDGRHTAATLLLSEGVHPRVVMEVLGHAQMRTTT